MKVSQNVLGLARKSQLKCYLLSWVSRKDVCDMLKQSKDTRKNTPENSLSQLIHV